MACLIENANLQTLVANALYDETSGYLVFDRAGVIEFANKEAGRLLGEKPDKLLGTRVKKFELRLDWAHLILPIKSALAGRIYENDVAPAQNDRRNWNVRCWPLKDGGAGCRFERISETRPAMPLRHDPLTALPNRQLFTQQLSERLEKAKQTDRSVEIACFDLDYFKWLNSTLGQRAGDVLLVAVSRRIQASLPDDSFLCRLGGDEFAAALPISDNTESACEVWQEIHSALRQPYAIDGHRVSVQASLGTVKYPKGSGRGASATDLVDRADFTMRQAKSRGRGRIVEMDTLEAEEFNKQKNTVQWLHKAVAERTFELHYQPIVDVRSGHVSGFEALLRSTDGVNGMQIAAVIDLVESEGLMPDLGLWIFKTACARLAQWRSQDGHDVSVSINLAPAQLLSTNFADEAQSILRANQLEPRHVMLEISESLAVNEDPTVINTIEQLLQYGFHFALDDFGLQFAPIGRLNRLSFHQIKFDKSLTAKLDDSSRESELVSKMMSMMNRSGIGFDVVAEGIENDKLRECATCAGADLLQGYGLHRPMTATVASNFLNAQ